MNKITRTPPPNKSEFTTKVDKKFSKNLSKSFLLIFGKTGCGKSVYLPGNNISLTDLFGVKM